MASIDRPIRPSWNDNSQRSHNHSERLTDPFHHTRQWRKIRLMKLHANPLCEHCEGRGKATPAIIVDHIIPIQFGGHRTDMGNMQSLCRACDNKKAGQDSQTYKKK